MIPLLESYQISTIAEADNGFDLLSILKSGVSPDVILLDLQMPEMDGGKTLDLLKNDFLDAKVIILTQYEELELKKNLISRGAVAYINKATDIEIVARCIKEVSLGVQKELRLKTKGYYTKREIEIIDKICRGKSNKEIANDLNIVTKTVEAHKNSIYRKSQKESTFSFLEFAFRHGLNYLK